MLTMNDVYYGKIFIEEKFDSMLAEYGVIVLGAYNKDLGCFENCLMSGVVNDKLKKLAQDNILGFDGVVVNQLDGLTTLLKRQATMQI
ncbi:MULTISPECIES: hypothetical protein [Bacillus cereus group]|nr:hypothetical protein [Bacillus cereus]MCU5282069.1 hypothetical protein [Bacillus cereus]PES55471.1 hypothetical protein CN515_05355 [Bacillus cereus]